MSPVQHPFGRRHRFAVSSCLLVLGASGAAVVGCKEEPRSDLGTVHIGADEGFEQAWAALEQEPIRIVVAPEGADDKPPVGKGHALMGRVRPMLDHPSETLTGAGDRYGVAGPGVAPAGQAPAEEPGENAPAAGEGNAPGSKVGEALDDLPEFLTFEDVSSVVKRRLGNVQYCYRRLTRTGNASPSGRAIVSFTVGADGSVTDIHVLAPAFERTELPRCVSQQVSRWSFPASRKGGLEVRYPFVFVAS